MQLSTFERFLPWTGAIAGLAWIAQSFLYRVGTEDHPGKAATATIHDQLTRNYGAVACLVVMGIALVFFATALRGHLRSGEAREATYSAVAYGGLLLTSAGLSQMVMWNWGLINGAADAHDDQALHVLSYVSYFGFAGMGIGVATMLIATGLAGISNAVLPRWFAILTLVMGVLSMLGTAGIPPGGLVNYLLLPFWLIATAVILARRQIEAPARSGPIATHPMP
jgi:hypothetical protein